MMRILLCLLLLSHIAECATFYCGPSNTGSGTGADFNNLIALPDSTGFTRGNSYIIVDGIYGGRTLSTATSGTSTITIQKASEVHSAISGYATTIHDGAATFGDITVHTQYWIIDGVTRTETTRMEAPASYGIRIAGAISSNTISGENASNSQFSFLDIGGTWNSTGTPDCSAPQQALYFVYSQQNITFTRCIFHNAGVNNGAIAMMHGSSDITFDHCDFYMGWGKATIAAPNAGITRLTVKYCRFWNSSRTDSCPAAEGPGITCEVGSYSIDSDHVGHLIYGNIFYGTASGGRNASIMFGEPARTGEAQNCKVFNNTFVGFPEDSVLSEIYLKGGSGNEVRNNLFWDTTGSVTITANTSSNTIDAATDPFVDYANLDFRIEEGSQAEDAGTSLGSPYNIDAAGNTRGADGTWDVGAYEVAGTASDPVFNITTLTLQ